MKVSVSSSAARRPFRTGADRTAVPASPWPPPSSPPSPARRLSPSSSSRRISGRTATRGRSTSAWAVSPWLGPARRGHFPRDGPAVVLAGASVPAAAAGRRRQPPSPKGHRAAASARPDGGTGGQRGPAGVKVVGQPGAGPVSRARSVPPCTKDGSPFPQPTARTRGSHGSCRW